ncbi:MULTISPECIES: cell wall-binding repeat-containing protein [unclassified Leucobacter]|uniref:cell wall-binding repeat-containing protein n=1 Tax=unclassified Leucobacter TaxID=2621730 RepID=UPI00069A18FD
MPVRTIRRLVGLTLSVALLTSGAVAASPAFAEDAPAPEARSAEASAPAAREHRGDWTPAELLERSRERKSVKRPAALPVGAASLHGTIDVPAGVLDPDDFSAVVLASSDGTAYYDMSSIEADGGYAFSGVDPGEYVLIAAGTCGCEQGWFTQLLTAADGTVTVSVADGADTTWNAAMAVPDAQVSGTAFGLRDSFDAGVAPIVYTKADGRWIQLDMGMVREGPLSSRAYVLPMLRSGTYTVGLIEDPDAAGRERMTWLGGASALQSAKPVALAAAENRTGTDLGFPGRPVVTAANLAVKRFSGADRFDTSAAISRAAYPFGASTVYVANGNAFPDALAGAAAAGAEGAPVLLVRSGSIPAAVRTELSRLRPENIIVLGGAGAVSVSVQVELEQFADYAVRRMAGADRYQTAATISRKTSGTEVPAVYVASGMNFPDALAGAAAAGAAGAPVLLVPQGTIPAAVKTELARLRPEQIIVLGGTGAVSRTVESQLRRYASNGVARIDGPDRFGTSVAISESTVEPGAPIAYVADGMNFPDALAGAAVAAAQGGPILLVRQGSIPSTIGSELSRLQPQRIAVLGGTGAVGSGVQAQLKQYLVP